MAGNDRAQAGAGQAALDSVLAKIPGYINKLIMPENYPWLLKVMAQFNQYSFQNAVLIAAQCRKDRIFLAGRKTWERKYSRRVKSGEKGISVILPASYKKRLEQAAGSRSDSGKQETGTVTVPRFCIVDVYDISQTDGAFMEFPAPDLSAAAAGFQTFINALDAVSPKPLYFADIGENAAGYTYDAAGGIVIQDGMEEAAKMKTAVCAVVRAIFYELEDIAASGYGKNRADCEMEVNSAAFMVCHYFGLDTTGFAFMDVADWRGGMDMDGLRSCMDAVRRLASAVIYGVLTEMRLWEMRETGFMSRDVVRESASGWEKGEDEAVDSGAMTGVYRIADRMIFVEPPGDGRMYYVYDDKYSMVGGGLLEPDFTAWQAALDVARHLKGQLYDAKTGQYTRSYEQGHVGRDSRLVEMDLDVFRDRVKAAQLGVNAEAGLESQKPPPVSGMTEPERAFLYYSRSEIEEMAYSYAKAAITDSGLSDVVEVIAARVYGSRCREGLYTERSDIDIAISYSGDIREDDFFNMLNGDGFQIDGIPVDMNPVSVERAGTLEEYMERAARYLDRKEAQMKAAVDMVDRKEAQMKAAAGMAHQETQEEKISFYAAECMEFPVMGEFYENLTLAAAVEQYHKIPAGRMDAEKGIGFQLDDGAGVRRGALLIGTEIQRESISLDLHLKGSGLVMQAAMELEKTFMAQELRETGALSENSVPVSEKAAGQDTGAGMRTGPQEQGSARQHEQIKYETGTDTKNMQRSEQIKNEGNTDAKNAGHDEKPERGAQAGTGRKQSVLQALRARQAVRQQGPQEKETRTHRKGEQEL